MGADSSKEESRYDSPEQNRRRNQYVRQQRRQEPACQAAHQSPPQAPIERSRTPYSYTTEHLQTAVKQDSPNILERPRAPYNYNSQELQHGFNKSPQLYPNLNVQEEGYVYVQSRTTPQPSAPPASEVNALPEVPARPAQPSASRLIHEPPPELPKAPSRPSPPQISTVPKILPTTRPLVSEISTVPNNSPTSTPSTSMVPKNPPTTRPLVSEISTVPNNAPTSTPSTSTVPMNPSTTRPLVSEISTVPNISPISTPSASLRSTVPITPLSSSTVPKNPPTTRPLVSEISTVPQISPTSTPSAPSISTVPITPPTSSTVPKNPPTPGLLVSSNCSMHAISTVPKISPTSTPSTSLSSTVPMTPPTSSTVSKSPLTMRPLVSSMHAISMVPKISPTSTPSTSLSSTMPMTPLTPRYPVPLLNMPEFPASQFPATCEVKSSPYASPISTQSAQSTLSPNAPGTSQSAYFSANKNRQRPAARNRGNNDSYSCPTCGQHLGLTIYQCLGGHSCCKDCRLAERTCGNCHSPITDMRNITLEAYIAEVTKPCQNPSCTLSFNAYEMERHLKECPFGDIDCPMGTFFGQCSTRCKVADLAAHFDVHHKEQRTAEIDKEMYVFNICMETHKLFLIKTGPYTFLVHVKVHENERKISMAVQLLGTNVSAGKWSYEIHVYNKRQPLRKYLYVDSCQSISTPVDDIFNGQCASLPLTYAMTFVNESALTYKFYIKKETNLRGRRGPKNNATR